ncbi:hypothetical protein [Sporosalibacterium faouarense]|uniref:hypothetical protein n=1 Tax=Sporosalibacterium faouarense TaxID=516123 RepID=UPI00141C50A1|nr:hypothetical protein [Sporosalibacterium faouarense]MTI47454.1 hypothetical protein [Bacillota bacterium]
MKKSMFISILILLFLISGCETQESSSQSIEEKMIDKVKILAVNDIKFKHLDITYSDYKSNIEGILVDWFPDLDDEVIFSSYDENGQLKEFKGIDLKGLSIDDLKAHKEKLKKDMQYNMTSFISNENVENTLKISDVYDPNVNDFRYVFTQRITKFHDEKNTVDYVNKRYTLQKIDNEWKIINIEKSMTWYYDGLTVNGKDGEKAITLEELIKMPKYTSYNNEEIEYIIELDPLE